MTVLLGHILTPSGWKDGQITTSDNGRIQSIESKVISNSEQRRNIVPGFIDLHVHGGGGADIMDGLSGLQVVSRLHARFGTTALLATTMTADRETTLRVLKNLGENGLKREPQAARVLGVHLEGPYIEPGKLGAHPPLARLATLEEIEQYLAVVPVKLVTLAPECAGHMDLIPKLNALGVKVQIGHSRASYDQGVTALKAGASGFTHLFNAMNVMHHREPGLVGAALAHADYAEIIPDLMHVSPGAIRVALRAIPRLYCVTDSTAGAGMPDGEYRLGSQIVTKCLGGVRLADGTLAGSTLTMDQAFRNLMDIGLDPIDASNRLSLNPADYLGLNDRGRLAEGAFADCVVFDNEWRIKEVWVEGERIDFIDVK
jgi:N-acetylglucosamine-6-phosphate deacetylase